MKKIKKVLSIIIVSTICSILLMGCSKEQENTAITTNNVNDEIILNTSLSFTLEDEDNDENIQKNTENIIIGTEEIEDSDEEELIPPNTELLISEKEELPIIPETEIIETKTNEKEYIDFSLLKETSIKEGLYQNIDITTLVPSNNFELSMDNEGLMKMVISTSNKNNLISISSSDIIYEMYTIDNTMYSHAKQISEDYESFSYALVTEENNTDSLTEDMGATNYSSVDIKDVKYVSALIDENGRIFDVLEVLIDSREEDEKDMLAYETPNGIMYLSEGVTMTVEGITYGGEDGVQPLDQIPYDIHKFYIERSTQKLKGMKYENNGVPVTAHINEITEITLPESFNGAQEVTSEDIAMEMFTVIMMIAMNNL